MGTCYEEYYWLCTIIALIHRARNDSLLFLSLKYNIRSYTQKSPVDFVIKKSKKFTRCIKKGLCVKNKIKLIPMHG